MIQSGLLDKWKEVYWNEDFRKVKISVNQNDLSQDKLKLNQILDVFYIIFCFLSLSIATLLIEILFRKILSNLIGTMKTTNWFVYKFQN